MFQKALDKIREFFGSLDQKPTELQPGVIVDSLSQESFPARSDIAGAIEPTVLPLSFGSALGPAVITVPPMWNLRFRKDSGQEGIVSLDEVERRHVIEAFRDQVSRDGIVSTVPLPDIGTWLDDKV